MATSLLFALLGIEPSDLVQGAYLDPTSPKGKYLALQEKQRRQIQRALYNALYTTIEYSYLPQNEPLNMAIGEALAKEIHEDPKSFKNDIVNLRTMLEKVIAEAIKDV